MPIPWFDNPSNNPGNISYRLSVDAEVIHTLVTSIFGTIIQCITTLVAGLVIALIYEWRSALVALGLLPLMILAGIIQGKIQSGFSNQADSIYKDSSSLITEGVTNIRTVISFGYETVLLDKYAEKLKKPYSFAKKKGIIAGLLFGVTQFIMFLIFGIVFYLGAIFTREN